MDKTRGRTDVRVVWRLRRAVQHHTTDLAERSRRGPVERSKRRSWIGRARLQRARNGNILEFCLTSPAAAAEPSRERPGPPPLFACDAATRPEMALTVSVLARAPLEASGINGAYAQFFPHAFFLQSLRLCCAGGWRSMPLDPGRATWPLAAGCRCN